MATVNVTLDCTATGNPSVSRSPSHILNATGTGTAFLLRSPRKILTATGTGVLLLLKLPQKVLRANAISNSIITIVNVGVNTFSIFEGKTKWVVSGVNRFQLGTKKRFTFLVRGKPYG